MKKFIAGVAIVLVVSVPSAFAGKCPLPKDIFQKIYKASPQAGDFFSPERAVVKEVGSFCVYGFVSKKPPYMLSVITTDKKGRYALPGAPIDLEKRVPVGVQKEAKVFYKENLSDLKGLAFKVAGRDEVPVFLIVSMTCPHCQKMADLLVRLGDLVKKSPYGLYVIPLANSEEDVERAVCYLMKGDFLEGLAKRKECTLTDEEKKSSGYKEMKARLKKLQDYVKNKMSVSGVPLMMAGDGEVIVQGYSPERITSFFFKKALESADKAKDKENKE